MSTAVDEIRNVVLLFSNPSWVGGGTIPTTIIRNITALSSQIAYNAHIRENITVLVAKHLTTVNGLLYVPDLPDDDPCIKQAETYVPNSVVRRANLPPTNYNLVALAPWVSSACAKKYLASANTDPIRAFIFYRTNNLSVETPPPSSPAWDINGSTRWKTQSTYPIFAVPGLVGQEMMTQLSFYSGNITDVPFGQNISQTYDPDPEDYVRIWTDITLSQPSGLLGIWVYFLIVIAVLFGIVSATSLMMHLAQARRRASLRRRVILGEVNLEAMGIKRLTVPHDEIQKFPLYTYHYEPSPSPPVSPKSVRFSHLDENSGHDRNLVGDLGTEIISSPLSNPSEKSVDNYQPSCTICLAPYQNRTTVIRELRCGHIFHPDCIDDFLSDSSSLCPLCKANMLPQGYCPKITNAMVRRELAVRRLRHSATEESAEGGKTYTRTFRLGDVFRGVFKSMSIATTPLTPAETEASQPVAPGSLEARMPTQKSNRSPEVLARTHTQEFAIPESDDETVSQPSMWKRIRTNVFPGF